MDKQDIISLRLDPDVMVARMAARRAAMALGFSPALQARIVATASDLAHRMLARTGKGWMTVRSVRSNARWGLELIFEGADFAVTQVFPMPRARHLMEEIEVEQTTCGNGRVVCRQWLA